MAVCVEEPVCLQLCSLCYVCYFYRGGTQTYLLLPIPRRFVCQAVGELDDIKVLHNLTFPHAKRRNTHQRLTDLTEAAADLPKMAASFQCLIHDTLHVTRRSYIGFVKILSRWKTFALEREKKITDPLRSQLFGTPSAICERAQLCILRYLNNYKKQAGRIFQAQMFI